LKKIVSIFFHHLFDLFNNSSSEIQTQILSHIYPNSTNFINHHVKTPYNSPTFRRTHQTDD